MALSQIMKVTTILLGLLYAASSDGSFAKKKIQIRIPHNIQHHHHTHTKYHFITLPLVRALNRTDTTNSTNTNPTPGVVMVPVMPFIPGLVNATNGLIPVQPNNLQPIQPNNLQPMQPNNMQPIQPNNMQPMQPNNFPPVQPNNFPPGQPLQPNNFPPVQPLQPNNFQQPNNQLNNFPPNQQYYQYNSRYDDSYDRNRRSRDHAAAPDLPVAPSMKFKTVINVQETKKIPLMELLDLSNLLKKDPPQRIKVEVLPEKTSHVRQQHVGPDWQAFRENFYRKQDHEYVIDSSQLESKTKSTVDNPEWRTVKRLLEKHIHEDFPGLKVEAEIRPANAPQMKERTDTRAAEIKEEPTPLVNMKHIGFIIIDDNNEQRFVAVDEGSAT